MATRYTTMATAIKTCKSNGMFLRNRQIRCHGLWPSLSNPNVMTNRRDSYTTVRYSTLLLQHEYCHPVTILTIISCWASWQAEPSPTASGVGTVPLRIPRSWPPPLCTGTTRTRGRRRRYRAPTPTQKQLLQLQATDTESYICTTTTTTITATTTTDSELLHYPYRNNYHNYYCNNYRYRAPTSIQVKLLTWVDSRQAELYNLGSGSWLAWANDTVAHYAATHCWRWLTTGPAVQHTDIPPPNQRTRPSPHSP